MISRRSFRLCAFACAAAIAGAACGGATDGGDAAQPATPETVAGADETGATAVDGAVPAALQFTAPLVGGGEFVGDQFAGKPTAFWFWSPT